MNSPMARALPELLSADETEMAGTWHVVDYGHIYFDVFVVSEGGWGRNVFVADRVSGRCHELHEESSAMLETLAQGGKTELPARNIDLAILACEVVLRGRVPM
jgi:hypothetical protein